jgi:hypothetical protein
VTQGYVHLNTALVVAAVRVSMEIAQLLDGGAAAKHRKNSPTAGHDLSIESRPTPAIGRLHPIIVAMVGGAVGAAEPKSGHV